jgi:hypothetical protein
MEATIFTGWIYDHLRPHAAAAPGVAEDNAQVVSLTGSVSVPFRSWQGNVLLTNEWSPLEPKVTEEKDYALDVGLVRTTTIKGGTGESVLVSITHQEQLSLVTRSGWIVGNSSLRGVTEGSPVIRSMV